MRVAGDVKEILVSQMQLARAIGISQARVNQLIDEGIVIRDTLTPKVFLFESVKNYYLNKNIGGADAEANHNVEKALYMRA